MLNKKIYIYIQKCQVVTEEKVDDADTRMETSHRKSLCQLAVQSGRPKSPAHKAAKLSELHTYSYFTQDNATDHTGNFLMTALKDKFGKQLKTHKLWPLTSADLNLCNYYLLQTLKIVYVYN